ncbi:hypothetical protein GQ54DRAFT_112601 [Martensiomyces pterosporus]|nr:hypothetical protein GQ54DRAFT_112601 [Martensiomyces pterosporus]
MPKQPGVRKKVQGVWLPKKRRLRRAQESPGEPMAATRASLLGKTTPDALVTCRRAHRVPHWLLHSICLVGDYIIYLVEDYMHALAACVAICLAAATSK